MTLQGAVLDSKFARALLAREDLLLGHVLLLDRVQKRLPLEPNEIATLRQLGLVEGRANRLHISASVAASADQKAKYIRDRGMDDSWYRKLVLDFLAEYGKAVRKDFDELLLPKLPDVLSDSQKTNKVKNLLQAMRREGSVHTVGPRTAAVWYAGPAPLDLG